MTRTPVIGVKEIYSTRPGILLLVVGWLTPKMSQHLAIDNQYYTNCASKSSRSTIELEMLFETEHVS